MPLRAPSLRRTLTLAMIAVAALVITATVMLAVVTALVNRSSRELAAGVESVHAIEAAKNDLLIHERAIDPLVRAEVAAHLRARLDRAQARLPDGEQPRLRDARDRLDAYFGSDDPTERAMLMVGSYSALEALAQANLTSARVARRDAVQWSRAADVICVGLAALIVAALGFLIWWIHSRALRPVEVLAGAMDRFGRGEADARAAPSGPAELRDVATRFNDMATTLARQRAAQMTFLAGVAHDLRNPLHALRLSTEVARFDAEASSNQRMQQMLDRFGRQVSGLERMVTDLLDVARIEAGQLELQLARQDAREIVRQVADLFRVVSAVHQIDVEVPDQPVWLRCDPLRIDQVVTNLLSNAIKYSPRGGRVGIAVSSRADEVVLEISDQGIGMSDADVRAMFEPFRRGDGARDGIEGAGLGMSVVRRIVGAHDGHIDVRSQLGRGSTVEVHLPAG